MTIYTSPFPSVEVNTESVHSFLLSPTKIATYKDRAALIDATTGQQTTYGQLADESLRFASGLTTQAGLKRGQSLLIFSPNSMLYPVLMLAGQAAGVIVSTANSSYGAEELAHALDIADAVVVLVSADLLSIAQDAVKQTQHPDAQIYVLPGSDGALPASLPRGVKSYTELRGSPSFRPVQPTAEEAKKNIAYLPFSSGTTGKAKGVALSSSNITTCILQASQSKELFGVQDTVLSVLPMFHIFGLVVMLHLTFYHGGTCVVLPKFDLPTALNAVQKYKCTSALVVPPIALALAKHPIVDQYDLTSLRYILCGAAPLSAELQEALAARLKGRTYVVQGLGMTETTSVGVIPYLEGAKPGYVGKLISTMEARLVDVDGKDVKRGEAGELWLRGPNVMLGYHKIETKDLTPDGWLMTGDICERDEEGNYRVVERSKDLIKYKGFQVAPAEVEGILLTSPLVTDCAVIGVWSEEQATELPRAYIVPHPDHAQSPTLQQDVAKHVEQKLAHHKRLRGGVFVLDAIPKSASGKILKKDLRVLAAQEGETKSKL
ncbi:hypothetical protein B0A53_04732 [Rhodotorula sp. CCFEE 5036]|nr:hypothetical protein B0A53_04732 [Rhodotorula sp. CCFEE 5036]